MIIDNIPENFKNQPNNGFPIKTWTDDIKDSQLDDLCKILKGNKKNLIILLDIYLLKVPDVRITIKKIKDLASTKLKNNLSNVYSDIDITKFL